MRILWFSVTPSLFNPKSNSVNGGGWVASLEQIVRGIPDVDLGVAFYFPDTQFRYDRDGVAYYPIAPRRPGIVDRLRGRRPDYTDHYLRIIRDFKPDLIQLFGSESDYGKICRLTDIPVVIHMQGSIPPYHNALFPQAMNTADFYLRRGLSLRQRIFGIRADSAFRRTAAMETETLKSCRHFMGRTDWDRNIVALHNPAARYYHCEEALRDSFIASAKRWQPADDGKVRIISVISTPWYKGLDVILKTARLLKDNTGLDFEWRVYGIRDARFFEKKYGIRADDVNVRIMGTASKDELVEALTSSSVYVHTSYIDNSPNSLCEAQYLGVPVLATFVGGIPSMVADGEDGILYPANDPYTLAGLIKRLAGDRELCERLSAAATGRARRRHDPAAIAARLHTIYSSILSE